MPPLIKLLIVACFAAVKFAFWMAEKNPPGGTPPLDDREDYRERMQRRALEAEQLRNQRDLTQDGGGSVTTSAVRTQAPPTFEVKRVVESTQHKDLQKSLIERCKRIDGLIKSRFGPTELTATRYRLLIDEVRLGVLSNIERQIELAQSAAHLDRDEIEQRMRGESSAPVLDMLEDRIQILDHVDKRIAELETANEQALTTLDRAILTLVDATPLRGSSTAQLQRSVSDLEELLSKAHRHGASGPADSETVDSEVPELTGSTKKKDPPKITPGAS